MSNSKQNIALNKQVLHYPFGGAKPFDYTTFASSIVEPILKVATDKQIEAKVKVQQNAAMKKEIEVVIDTVTITFATFKPYGSNQKFFIDTIYIKEKGSIISKTGVLTPIY